jgi:hypothetical protein
LKEAVQDVGKAPDREPPRAALTWQLEKLLTEDHGLATELAKRLEETKAAGVNVAAYGPRSVAIGGDVMGGSITTGDVNPQR